MDPLSLNMLAEKFYLSPYYICKIFKESTGFTFIEYLNKMRVKEAQKLLRAKGSTVLGISEKVGCLISQVIFMLNYLITDQTVVEIQNEPSKASYPFP